MRFRKDIWNTYHSDGFRHNLTGDGASAGGTISYQVKKIKDKWYQRVCQCNQCHYSYTPIEEISSEVGEVNYKKFVEDCKHAINLRAQMRKEFPNSGW